MLIKIIKGYHRGQEVSGIFQVAKPWKAGAGGGFVTIVHPIDPAGINGFRNYVATPRISCEQGDFVMVDTDGNELAPAAAFTVPAIAPSTSAVPSIAVSNFDTRAIEAFRAAETDEEAMERIRHTFLMLDKATDSVAAGIMRALIVTGAPGIGKSYGVEKQLQKASLFYTIKTNKLKYKIVSGTASAIGLYQILWEFKDKDCVVCFDDCDSILFDEECLNILKRALNTGDNRKVSWNKESRVLANEDIPDSFDFAGGIIFLTNINFENVRSGRVADHLRAIISRSHYMDMELDSMRDKILRIKQCITDGMLSSFEFKNGEEQVIIDWIVTNKEYVRELSVRMAGKIGELVKAFPTDWIEYAESTCLTREAKYTRLMAAKQKLFDEANALEIENGSALIQQEEDEIKQEEQAAATA